MHKSLIAVLLASAFSLDAHAADLLQVYQQALANDATFASARASLQAGMERVPQARALLLPSISGSASISRGSSETTPWNVGQTVTNPQTGLPFTIGSIDDDSRSRRYGVSLSQPLFNWASWQTYQQSKLTQGIIEAQFAQAQQDLITRVAQAYFDVLASQDTLESIRAQKTATTEQLASAKRNFEVGTQTITDTHEAQAAYDLVVAQEFAAATDLENKRSALQSIIGTAPTALAPLKPGVALTPPQPAVIDQWVSSAETQNFAVIGATLNVESAKRDISRNRAGHYPTANLIADANRVRVPGQSEGSGTVKSNSIGVTLAVPIFNGFAVTSRVREAIALEDKARNDLEATRRNAAQGARVAFASVNSGLAQVRALEAAEVSSQSALDSNKLGYQVGVRINIDVLNAQNQLYLTRRNLSRARYDTIINGLRLKAAAGVLKEADLVTINTLLQH
ncbi:TolC family outer membrane protein [Pseudoduganella sp. GCM10020061]|jgi:outer membrane protein|uniref:TolC family outer membrane protein n=1 Tax=Pseudoduganella sp. GCM10020061 TaxID=3317345 RepID=UPI00363BF783